MKRYSFFDGIPAAFHLSFLAFRAQKLRGKAAPFSKKAAAFLGVGNGKAEVKSCSFSLQLFHLFGGFHGKAIAFPSFSQKKSCSFLGQLFPQLFHHLFGSVYEEKAAAFFRAADPEKLQLFRKKLQLFYPACHIFREEKVMGKLTKKAAAFFCIFPSAFHLTFSAFLLKKVR